MIFCRKAKNLSSCYKLKNWNEKLCLLSNHLTAEGPCSICIQGYEFAGLNEAALLRCCAAESVIEGGVGGGFPPNSTGELCLRLGKS